MSEAEDRIDVEESVGRRAEDGKLPSSVAHRRETLADVKKRWRCRILKEIKSSRDLDDLVIHDKTGKKPNTTSKLPTSPQMTTSINPQFDERADLTPTIDYRAVSPNTATDSGYGSLNITPVFAQSEKSVTIPQSPFSDGWHELPSLFYSTSLLSSCYDEVLIAANSTPSSASSILTFRGVWRSSFAYFDH